MASTASTPRTSTAGGNPRREQRRVVAAERAAAARRAEQRRRLTRWLLGGFAALAVIVVAAYLVTRGDDNPGSVGAATAGAPTVGGDLHTITTIDDALYVAGHAAAAVSQDNGRTWQEVQSLEGADPMGWAVTPDVLLAGGHPGLYRSTDRGESFTLVSGASALPDVHALGGAGDTLYAASPQAGLLASTDGGTTWLVRNAQAGLSFMGTILVDPQNPERLIAPDMAAGLTASTDGGRTWNPLGGPTGAMAAAWNPTDIEEIIAVGMNGGARSTDGGATWQNTDLPAGTSTVTYAADGRTLYAGALEGERAITYRSSDGGATWTATA